jgi:SHOCT-like protein
MATAEERMKILKMVEEGKISAEDGAKLLTALNEGRKAAAAPAASPLGGEAHWFRVRVSDLASGRTTTTMNIPLGMVSAAIKMGARFAPNWDQGPMEAFTEALKAGASGKIIDVTDEDKGERVEIFVE